MFPQKAVSLSAGTVCRYLSPAFRFLLLSRRSGFMSFRGGANRLSESARCRHNKYIKRRLLTLVLAFLESSNFEAPKQDSAISVLVGMLISVRAPHRAGGLNISGVDVIVYSWIRVISGTSLRRISVDNVRAFLMSVYVC